MGKLQNKTVIVTGASSGFGEAIAIACAAEGARSAWLRGAWNCSRGSL